MLMNEPSVSRPNRLPLLLAVLVLSVLVHSSAGGGEERAFSSDVRTGQLAVPAPEVRAEVYLVRFVQSPEPVLERRAWKKLAPASLTKFMTALIAREELGSEGVIPFSQDAKHVEQKLSDVSAGDRFGRDDAIRFALMESDNDAALALAEAVGRKEGGLDFDERIRRFVGLMNRKASVLGLAETHFENPTGLDQDGHESSAADLATLAEYAYAVDPRLWEISKTPEAVVYSVEGKEYHLKSTDDLLSEFPGIAGSKTGFTDRARGALMLLYPVRGRGIAIIVILKSEDRFGDGRAILRWLDENYQ